MSEAHENTRIRQLTDAAAHWEHKYSNARQYNRNLEERNQKLEAALLHIADWPKNQLDGVDAARVAKTVLSESQLETGAKHD